MWKLLIKLSIIDITKLTNTLNFNQKTLGIERIPNFARHYSAEELSSIKYLHAIFG